VIALLKNGLFSYPPLNEVGGGYGKGVRPCVRHDRFRRLNWKPFKISQPNLVHILIKKPIYAI